jgi:ABC-2 type transport system permease protein
MALGGGIPIAFFVINLVSTMSDKLGFLKNFSLISLFDSKAVVDGEPFLWKLFLLLALGIILYIASIRIFKKKDLPL